MQRSTSRLAGNASGVGRPADQRWQRNVRIVCQEYEWEEKRDDVYGRGSVLATDRLIDFLALHMKCETLNLGCTNAYFQAPETGLTTPEYKAWLVEKGQDRGAGNASCRGSARQRWVEHFDVPLLQAGLRVVRDISAAVSLEPETANWRGAAPG